VITGVTGSLMVISVNAWMNHPAGFTVRDGKVVDVHAGIVRSVHRRSGGRG
jgi:cytochrome bd-type quinol oxidase subunit 1